MKLSSRLLYLSILLFSLSSTAMAESSLEEKIAAGRSASSSCMACHGPQGLSSIPGTPHLKGQQAKYIADQLLAFRENKRVDANKIMSAITKALSDKDIENLAAYYESLGK